MSKHTPGPWKMFGDELYGADGTRIAEAVSERDAPILRAAPGLLAALKELVQMDDDCQYVDEWSPDVWERARAAIAKAEQR